MNSIKPFSTGPKTLQLHCPLCGSKLTKAKFPSRYDCPNDHCKIIGIIVLLETPSSIKVSRLKELTGGE
jgi:hypothetical protein